MNNHVCLWVDKCFISSYKHLGVVWLGHMAGGCLHFKENVKQFYRMDVHHFTISLALCKCPHPTNSLAFWSFNCHHCNICLITIHCGLNSHFPNDIVLNLFLVLIFHLYTFFSEVSV